VNTLLFTPDGAWTIHDVKADQADRVLAILRETAVWLKSRGQDQWQDFIEGGQDIVARRLREGTVLLVEQGGQDAACAVLQWQDPFWGDIGMDGRSAWIHSLAVRRVFSGRGLGQRLIAFIENLALAKRRELCRLDVLDANTRLKAYYRDQGYRALGSLPFKGKSVRLMEKTLR
jgi:ribosomal protein S18 acetylase RimI-like enzyme